MHMHKSAQGTVIYSKLGTIRTAAPGRAVPCEILSPRGLNFSVRTLCDLFSFGSINDATVISATGCNNVSLLPHGRPRRTKNPKIYGTDKQMFQRVMLFMISYMNCGMLSTLNLEWYFYSS